MDIDVRIGGRGDLAEAQRIHETCYVATGLYDAVFGAYVARSIEAFAAAWDPERDRVWLAESDGRLVGYVALCHRDDGWGQLRYLYVDPVARGQGLGRELVGRVIDHARSWGALGVALWTMEGLDAARRIYESFGWRLIETTPAPWHAALRQQRFVLAFE